MGLGTVCVCVAGYVALRSFDPFAAMSQPDNGDGTYGPKPAHQCSTTIDGYEFAIKLNLIHPFLAEYEKILVISAPDGTEITSQKFIDTGGLASMYFFRDDETITIADGLADGVTFRKNDRTTSRGQVNELMDSMETDSIGRSMFSTTGYQYLDATEIAAHTSANSAE